MNPILNKGEVVNGTYTVKFLIGKGAFGEVYRVKHRYLGTQVLKVIKRAIYSDQDIETMISEALILSSLTHKNIVRVFDANVFTKNGHKYHYIATEFVSGETLQQLIQREIKLSFKKALKIEEDIVFGLREAHLNEPAIIHRDIKPANILLSYEHEEETVAKLTDFGLAIRVERNYPIAGVAGTFPYMADECFQGTYLLSSDVFSAGVVFYQMLTGMFPWEYNFNTKYNNHEEICTMILMARKTAPKPPSYFCRDCPEIIDKVMMKALKRDAEFRYKNAEEFYNDYESCLKNIKREDESG